MSLESEIISNPTKVSSEGIEFIGNYEGGYHTTPYDDGYGNPTIGYGHLITKDEIFTTITKEEALQLMSSDLSSFEKSVTDYSNSIGIIWDQDQYDKAVFIYMKQYQRRSGKNQKVYKR